MTENILPLVSIGMPVYNEVKYFEQTLLSVLNQDYPNKEILISDNCSNDGTWEIIQRYVNNAEIIAIRHKKNMGPSFNHSYVLNHAHGDFFIWVGGHDLWGDEKMLSSCVMMMLKDKNIALCVPETRWIEENGEISKKYPFEKINTGYAKSPARRVLLFMQQKVKNSSLMGLHRKKILLKTLPWRLNDDTIALYKIASYGDIITNTDVFWYRRINRNETTDEKVQRYKEWNLIKPRDDFSLYLKNRIITFCELLKIKGPIGDRLHLYFYYIRRNVANSFQFIFFISLLKRKIISEFF